MRFAFVLIAFGIAQVCLGYIQPVTRTRWLANTGMLKAIQYDAQGYEIKPRDWFNGLSVDPGNSLADPRAVPPPAKEFAERIKKGGSVKNFDETISLIDAHYNYFAVPFTCGDAVNPPNVNTGAAKVFSFGLMTKMSVDDTLKLFGEHYDSVKANPSGNDHANIRNFIKKGWAGVSFNTGLAIASKLQSYDDTDSAMATQSVLVGKGNEWDQDSDSWIP